MKEATYLAALLLVPLAALHAADAPKLPAAKEADGRLHADGQGWRLDKARITDPARPRVLLIGDSILNGYLRSVIGSLDGKAYVDAWVNPYCQSEYLNKLLAQVLEQGPYDVVHFNMGLHGWQEGRIKPGTFEPLTKAYVEAIRAKLPKAKIIWASSTPVTAKGKPTELDPTIDPTIVEHNRMAARVMAEMKVPVSDFYSLLADKLNLASGDQFHWTAPAYDLLAKAAVESVLRELGPPAQAPLVTPIEWLKAQPRPPFKEGHTLPPLARWGWAMSFDVAKELADYWGYAVEFSGYVSEKVADEALANPKSRNAQCLALVASDPKKYKLGILVDRQFPKDMPPEAYVRDAQGNFISDKGNPKVLSPEMPEDCLRQAGQLHAVGIAKLHTRCPVSIIQNGGEYGLNVLGWVQKYWEKDPRVIAAKGNLSWYQYISRRKAREQKAMADAIRAAAPDRILYVHYTCGGDTHRHGTVETFHDDWAWDFSEMRACADIATNEYYYHDFNSGWLGKDNMLTQALGAKGYEQRFGVKNSYDYLCPGYRQDAKAPTPAVWDATQPIDNNAKAFGDLRLYEGFLKCLYTAGMIGGVAGYFSYPKGGFDAAFSPDKPPQFLVQMVILGRVHALFSHQEAFLRQGDLLPGPNKHAKVTDQPAFEFPTGNPNRRVLARRMPGQPKWLITAWASDGVEGPATVEIPDLGSVTLQARAIGSVYEATTQDGKPALARAFGD